jgi:hypothetical protein
VAVDERTGEGGHDLVGAQVADATLPVSEIAGSPHGVRRELRVLREVRVRRVLRQPPAPGHGGRPEILEHGEGRPLRAAFHQPLRGPRGRAREIALHHVHQLVSHEPEPVRVGAVVEQQDRAREGEPDRRPRQIARDAPRDPDVTDEPFPQRRATAIGAEHDVGRLWNPEDPGERGRDGPRHAPLVGGRDHRVRRSPRAAREPHDGQAVRRDATIRRPAGGRDGQHETRAAAGPPSPQLRAPTATGTVTTSSRYGIAT